MRTETSRRARYLDASALVKLVLCEPESEALRAYVRGHDVVTSTLALAEVPRALWRRIGHPDAAVLENLFDGLSLVPASSDILLRAASYDAPGLRTLDAIHVASAETIRARVDAFVSYDRRQLDAVTRAGFPTASPM